MGRGARTPAWLDRLGYSPPPEQQVTVDVTYVSQLLRIPHRTLKEKLLLIGAEPGRTQVVSLFGYENDTWLFGVAGVAGLRPPEELAEMITFAEEFAPPHVLSAVRNAEVLGTVARHRFPASQWRRYDKMRRFPDGLLVFGDAICSFNPIYGQGMTVAALEALALRDCLRRGESDLPRRFFRAAAKPIGVAWQLAVGADLALPEIPGKRTLATRISNAYVQRYLAAAESDALLAERFFRVVGFVDPPARLLHPAVVQRVLARNRRRRQQHVPVTSVRA